MPDLLDRLLTLELRFTVKLIGKADQLLLKAYGQHVVGRDGQVTCLNHRARESRAGVTLTNERVTGIAQGAHQFSTQPTVADVGRSAMTIYLRRIAEVDTYVVQHGCLTDKRAIELQLRVSLCQRQRLVAHAAAVAY